MKPEKKKALHLVDKMLPPRYFTKDEYNEAVKRAITCINEKIDLLDMLNCGNVKESTVNDLMLECRLTKRELETL